MQTCTRCVMNDESDSTITFDENGVCNYCTDALKLKTSTYFPDETGTHKLEELIGELKEKGKGHDFDCIMGLSGGLDSSYLAYLGAQKWDLRIAAVHIDDGYDTEISQANIKKLCAHTNIELTTIAPDAEQFNALTLAYMKAGVPDLAVPQDNILFAFLYDYAKQQHITDFLSGGNFALESILQSGNNWSAWDVVNIKDIHRRFGTKPIDKLKFISRAQQAIDEKTFGMRSPRPLNYFEYNRDTAFAELADWCGFEYYGRKHLENYLTAFVQLYWLPKKFGVDKRRSHLSSMIVSGQLSREDALRELEEPLYEEAYMNKVRDLLCANLEISREELETFIELPPHQHDEYKIDKFFRMAQQFKKITSKG